MLIGITGTNCSGKGEVAEYLKKKGFAYFSLADIVRREARKRGVSAARENLIQIGQDLREKHGNGFLAEQVSRDIRSPAVIDSIRCPEEVDVLRKNRDFILLGIDAPIELRFERSRKRGRIGDGATLGEFKSLEEEENRGKGQQLQKTLKMSDFLLVNDKPIEHLRKQIDAVLKYAGRK
ncbi:MAG TPA: AAA family ATPase [Candidatus Nanoarchaeia archaeon]|nr:AAA family ATPase [Candidatus Nanoarchaeia archaeon]